MKFATIVLCAGLVGTLVVSNLQGATIVPGEGLAATLILDETTTGSIKPRLDPSLQAARLIDLQTGSTCRLPNLDAGEHFEPTTVGAACADDPALNRVSQWRATGDGTLEMADADGATVYRFAPGDGVLYESVYPENALVTIVPVKG